MKKTGLLVLLFATAAWAQTGADGSAAEAPQGTAPTTASFPTERIATPTYSDLYCAGFISKQILPDANFIAGGLQTPTTTKFTRGDLVYLHGTGYTAGAEFEIIRALRDVNEYEVFPGQRKLMKETGQPYEEVGRVKIVDARNKTAIAQIEYACDGVNPGDTAIPFAEKQTIQFHTPIRFDRFLPASSKVSGRIVMGKDFDSQLGTGQKVYMNVGSNQGVKIGDFFRAVRTYDVDLKDPVDSLSFKAAIAEDTQKKTPSVDLQAVYQDEWTRNSRARSTPPSGWGDCDHWRDQYDRNRHDRLLHGRCARWRWGGTRSSELAFRSKQEQSQTGSGNRSRFICSQIILCYTYLCVTIYTWQRESSDRRPADRRSAEDGKP